MAKKSAGCWLRLASHPVGDAHGPVRRLHLVLLLDSASGEVDVDSAEPPCVEMMKDTRRL